MTKAELKERLLKREKLEDILPLSPGQNCDIYKAQEFTAGDEIIYIPDVYLNQIVLSCFSDAYREEICGPGYLEYVDSVLDCCYTGDDFLEECEGDQELAECIFSYCDWEHPVSAHMEYYWSKEDGDIL